MVLKTAIRFPAGMTIVSSGSGGIIAMRRAVKAGTDKRL